MDRKEKAKGRRRKKAARAGNRLLSVGSSNRKWIGKRRPKDEEGSLGRQYAVVSGQQK